MTEAGKPRATTGPDATTDAGRAMVGALLAAHASLRRDLESLEAALRLLDERSRSAAEEVQGRIDALTMRQTAWQLRSFCESYCRTVHAHHSIEDFRIFPSVLRIAPGLAPIVDRLTADHLELGKLLDDLVAAVGALPGPDAAWTSARNAAEELAGHLDTHLAVEEEHIIPHLGRLPDWI